MKIRSKIFPILRKKIKSFLTDESGEVTKKNALWLAVWTMLLVSTSSSLARMDGADGHDNNHQNHDNHSNNHSSYPAGHVSGESAWHYSAYPVGGHLNQDAMSVTLPSHVSQVTNGPVSATPNGWHANQTAVSTDIAGHYSGPASWGHVSFTQHANGHSNGHSNINYTPHASHSSHSSGKDK